MGNILKPEGLTKEEKLKRQYDDELRHRLIARTRAAVVRSQIVKAYEILESVIKEIRKMDPDEYELSLKKMRDRCDQPMAATTPEQDNRKDN
jgi:hypothetical protein